jgi:hypothetical protein
VKRLEEHRLEWSKNIHHMSNRSGRSKVSVRKGIAPKPIDASELASAERTLARLVALAYACDHPDLFEVDNQEPATDLLIISATIRTKS